MDKFTVVVKNKKGSHDSKSCDPFNPPARGADDYFSGVTTFNGTRLFR
jgi:hypothetical protein